MIALASILLLASASSVELVKEVYQIPANDWRFVEVGLQQRPAFVSAQYRVESGPGDVRLALLRRDDIERLRNDLPPGVVFKTPKGASGKLEYAVITPGDYAIVVDNRAGARPARVHLRVLLDFAPERMHSVTRLSPRRQLTVILISFAVFFGIVSWSAHRLLRGMRR